MEAVVLRVVVEKVQRRHVLLDIGEVGQRHRRTVVDIIVVHPAHLADKHHAVALFAPELVVQPLGNAHRFARVSMTSRRLRQVLNTDGHESIEVAASCSSVVEFQLNDEVPPPPRLIMSSIFW